MRDDLADTPGTTLVAAARFPSGLAEDARADRAEAVRTLLSGPLPDAAVIMLGARDGAPLRDGAETVPLHGERWRQIYGDRVQAIADLFHARWVPLVWVGLPVVADEATSAGYVEINGIIRDRATAAGATYLDIWNAFTDEAGRYSAFGPDANGRATRLRTADGKGFTHAGAVKLASFVDGTLRHRRPAAAADTAIAGVPIALPRQPGFDAASSIDINAQIRREAGLPPSPPLVPPAAGRPAGPALTLTSPVLAPDGRLVPAIGDGASNVEGAASLARRALVEGRPIPSKPGRIDDFSWPPH